MDFTRDKYHHDAMSTTMEWVVGGVIVRARAGVP